MNLVLEATLKSAIAENNTHQKRIMTCKAVLSDIFPLKAETFETLTENAVAHVDQFVYRFSKMQDSVGTRFLPALYAFLEDNNQPQAFLDILNRLEQLGVLESVETWQFFRNLRNNLAHDYPETLEQTVQTLNLLYKRIEDFIAIYTIARREWEQRH